eukprot:3824670-Prymnesium_polylepis.2
MTISESARPQATEDPEVGLDLVLVVAPECEIRTVQSAMWVPNLADLLCVSAPVDDVEIRG